MRLLLALPSTVCVTTSGIGDIVCCRDEHYGFQLYQSDPSGNYGGWKAVAIGAGHQAAQNLLKTEYKDDITMEQAVPLVVKVMKCVAAVKGCGLCACLCLQRV